MRSLGWRLTVGYALAVTLAVGAALAAGRVLLEREMLHGIALLHEAENNEVLQDLGGRLQSLSVPELVRQMEAHARADDELFFFQVEDGAGDVLFRSPSLGASVLPDVSDATGSRTLSLPPHGPVYTSAYGHGPLRLKIGSRLAPTDRALAQYTQVGLLLAGLVAALSLGIGYGISRLALKPLRDIRRTAHKIGADNLSERIPIPPGDDEVADLVRLLNAMFDRLEAAFRQVRQFSADASHELKTPLTLMRLNAERLRERVGGQPESAAMIDTLLEEIARMNGLIETLLFLAKAEGGAWPLARQERDARGFVDGVAEDAAVLAEDRGLTLRVERNDAAPVRFDAGLMRQLLLNLVSNAVAVTPPGGTLTLRSALDGGTWRLELLDEGPGLPPERLPLVFERFSRETGERPAASTATGHGLGLAICRGIARLHGGEIRARNRTDRSGLAVFVELPE